MLFIHLFCFFPHFECGWQINETLRQSAPQTHTHSLTHVTEKHQYQSKYTLTVTKCNSREDIFAYRSTRRRRHGSCRCISGCLADIAAIAASSPVCRLSDTLTHTHTNTEALKYTHYDPEAQTVQMRCQNSCVYG